MYFAKSLIGKSEYDVNMTSYYEVTNSGNPVTMTAIRHHCLMLEFGRRDYKLILGKCFKNLF